MRIAALALLAACSFQRGTAATDGRVLDDAVASDVHSDGQSDATSAGIPIKFVQAVTHQNSGSSLQLMLPNVRAGDLLVGWFLNYQSGSQLAVSDDHNGAWTRGCSAFYDGGNSGDVALYYRPSSAAGTLTVTVTASGASFMQSSAAEFSGVAASSPLDRCVVRNGTSTTGTATTAPLNASGELVFAATVNGSPGTTITAGAGYTLRVADNNDACEDAIAGSTGSQNGILHFSSSTDWNMVVATFAPTP